MTKILFLFVLLLSSTFCFSQNQKPLFDIWLFPNPGLPRNANSSLFQDSLSFRPFQIHQPKSLQNQINQTLTGQYRFVLPEKSPFTLELWLLNHVNQPIGFEVFLGEKSAFGIWDEKINISGELLPQKPWRKYWTHLVAVFSEGKINLWENGEFIKTQEFNSSNSNLFLQSYLNQEPYMNLDHWIKHLVLHDGPLSVEQIQENFIQHQEMKNNGKRFPDTFHFLAEPYLFPTDDGIQLTFETDRKVAAKVFFGEKLPLEKSISTSSNADNICSLTITGLKPGAPYFYQVWAEDDQGNILDSGVLTFKTKQEGKEPIVFGVASDTEARTQINEQISLKLWDERVDFVIHMGDVTDGGKEKDKWQWTQEYFPGSAALTTRIPMIPTAGNGEGDLYWYKKYHPMTEPDGYFSYSYGSGEFFVLNSNQPDQLQPGGSQYEWLKKKLSASQSPWKFMYMHHAPYSADEDDYGNSWKEQSTYGDRDFQPLIRLLEEFGVDVMFFGHLHTYMRTFPLLADQIDTEKGIHYIQVGGMGGNLEDFAPNRVWFAEKTFRGFHYGVVSLTETSFKLNVYTSEGAMIDRLEIKK
jgi:predicted phosphodiesterase